MSRYRLLAVNFAAAVAAGALVAGVGASGVQDSTTPVGRALNLRSSVAGRTVTVRYDLAADDPRAAFVVALEASEDGGRTWQVRPTSVAGDVGPSVTPGSGKTIVWDAGKDLETPRFDRFQFRVVLTAVRPLPPAGPRTGRLSVTTTPPAATVLIDGRPRGSAPLTVAGLPAGEHQLTVQLQGYLENHRIVQVRADDVEEITIGLTAIKPAATQTKVQSAGHTNPLKWALIAGGGGAAAAGAAIAKSGGGGASGPSTSGGSSSPPPTQSTPATFTVSGRISDSVSLTALAGVVASVVGGQNDGRTATSNTSGDYSISGLLAGTFSIRFREVGWYEERTQTVTISAADQKLDVAMNANIPVPKFTWSFCSVSTQLLFNCLVDASTTQFGDEYRWTYEGGSGSGVTHSLRPIVSCGFRPVNTNIPFPVTLQVCNPSGHCRTTSQNVPIFKVSGCF